MKPIAHKFKVGDKIVVYSDFGRIVTVVESVVGGFVYTKISDSYSNRYCFHHKQCRKIKPSRRRIWVDLKGNTPWDASSVYFRGGVEFIEVRKKK